MKALSIKQPWAWLICAGYKDIENRTWPIGRNPRHGPYSSRDIDNFTIELPRRVYVHAGKTGDAALVYFAEESRFGVDVKPGTTFLMPAGLKPESLALGAIIGEVDITGCVTESKSRWFTGPYGFTLANPALYDKPIPYRGQLGFFEVVLPAAGGK